LRIAVLIAVALGPTACVENTVKQVAVTGSDAPLLTVEPGTLDFGDVPMGASSTLTLTVGNAGDADLDVSELRVEGQGAAYFAILEALQGRVLAPGESESVDVVFTATSEPGTTALHVLSNDAANPDYPVPLEAGLLVGALEANPNPVDFGNTAAGMTIDRTLTLTNVGGLDVTVSGLVVSGVEFELPAPSALPFTLPPGAAMPLDLTYAPTEDGVDTGYLWVTADDPAGVRSIPLVGSAGMSIREGDADWTSCYSEATGYDTNAGARLVVTRAATITVTYLGTDAGYSSDLWLYAPEEVRLARGHQSDVGHQVTLGPYARGTELIFGIFVNDTGDTWQSGEASRNSDGQVHGAITYNDDCSWAIGFEDLEGGGDRDYNDILLRVEGPLIEKP